MSPDTELPGAPRALMPSDGSGRGMRLPDFIMRLAPALLLALAAAGSAGCRDSAKKTPDLYEDSEFARALREFKAAYAWYVWRRGEINTGVRWIDSSAAHAEWLGTKKEKLTW